jgi:hypothetical protein
MRTAGACRAVLNSIYVVTQDSLGETHRCRWKGQEHREHPHVGDVAFLQEVELIGHAADLHDDCLQR